jgi:zinc/manganese transport system substrate-binding protein
MMLRYFWIAASALVLALPASATDRMTVVATFTVITDMLANVGGGHIEIKSIVGVNGDSELYRFRDDGTW